MAGRGGHPLSLGGVEARPALLFFLALALASAATFTPLDARDKLEGFNGAIPVGAHTVLLAGVVLSVLLALRLPSRGVHGVLAQAVVVRAFFVLAVVALWSARAGGLELDPLVPGHGLPLALLAFGAVAPPGVWRGERGPTFVGCAP